MKKILILTSGSATKLDLFKDKGVDLGSFRDVNYDSNLDELRFKNNDLRIYKLIYFRMVGKSLEIATLVANYAVKNNIKLVDNMYSNSLLMPISLGKSLEMFKLNEKGIMIPKTVFPVSGVASETFEGLDFPFIVKSTSGQKAREVWLVNNREELDKLKAEKIEKGKFYFAQELVPHARRVRVLVIGEKAVGAIVRQTKWNKDHTKLTLDPIPEDIAKLAVNSAKAVGLDISGIDIILNSQTGEKFVIEANAAPSWKLINKYCKVNVEDEIVKYIQTKI